MRTTYSLSEAVGLEPDGGVCCPNRVGIKQKIAPRIAGQRLVMHYLRADFAVGTAGPSTRRPSPTGLLAPEIQTDTSEDTRPQADQQEPTRRRNADEKDQQRCQEED